MAISKKQRIWPIIVIMGITILFGMVNGSQGRYDVPPAPFALMFDKNQLVRVMGSFLLVMIYILRYKFTTLKNGVLGTLWVIPLMMLVYYIGSGIEGLSDGFLGVLVKMTDVVGFYLLVYRLSLRENFRRIFLSSLAMMGTIFLAINLVALLVDPVNAFRAERFRGITFSVNWMGSYLALFLMPLFSQYLLSKKKIKIFWLIILLIAVTFLILTGARAAIITSLFSFVIFLWFIYKSKIDDSVSMKGVMGIMTLIFIGMSIVIMVYPEWFTVAEIRLSGNLDTRTLIFEAGWNRWTSPFLGMFDEGYGVESVFLTMLYVYGIVGFSILFMVFSQILLKAKIASKKFKSVEGPTGMAILIGFLINCFFEGLYFGTMSAFNLIFYIGLGLLFSATKKKAVINKKIQRKQHA
jgi:hypothetical protein